MTRHQIEKLLTKLTVQSVHIFMESTVHTTPGTLQTPLYCLVLSQKLETVYTVWCMYTNLYKSRKLHDVFDISF